MGVMLIPVLNFAPAVWVTLAIFCVLAAFAAVRSAGSSAMGLDQLPDRPGSMMGARTASAQLGYVIGAAGGGLVLARVGLRDDGLRAVRRDGRGGAAAGGRDAIPRRTRAGGCAGVQSNAGARLARAPSRRRAQQPRSPPRPRALALRADRGEHQPHPPARGGGAPAARGGPRA